MIYGIILILLGLLAAPSLLLSKKPNAKELLNKITPFQGWIGLVFCLWGIWGIIQGVLNLGMLSTAPIAWATSMATAVIEAVLGFLLGYGMINKHLLSKNDNLEDTGEEFLAKLAPKQAKLGLVGVCLGAWVIVYSLMS